MNCGLKLPNYKIARLQNPSRGYILITLMLAVALITIGLLAVLPEIKFQIQRDREQEMIRRGCAYARAVQRFYKKFGRYPTRIEELENTNSIRFLRQRYKDPITGKDFKILRTTDITLNNGPVLPGAQPAPIGGNVQQPNTPTGNVGQVTGLPAPNSGSQKETNPDSSDASGSDANSSDSSKSSSSSGLGGQVFGGGPILGVASTSKAKTIREFNNKNHYKDWLFIYDPSGDRGGLLNKPWQQDLGNRGFGGVTGQQPGMGPAQNTPTTPTGGTGPGGQPNPNPEPSPPDQ